MGPLEVLKEAKDEGPVEMPAVLRQLYGGPLALRPPVVLANFVSSLDGVVDIPGTGRVGRVLSGDSQGDRFVMGLLRASADAVLIGAGTLRASPSSTWTPEQAFPEQSVAFRELRTRRGLAPRPRVVVASASGDLDPSHPGLQGALVVTGEMGAAHMPEMVDFEVLIVPEGPTGLDLHAMLGQVAQRGLRTILSEAGPSITGRLVAQGLLAELFLTVSPLLAGWPPDGGRRGLVGETELLPLVSVGGELVSVRRQGSHLFLRYRLPGARPGLGVGVTVGRLPG
ncbi:MAG: dihydrofolate reductase family protein [Candidatus Dormibacteria bacterium]